MLLALKKSLKALTYRSLIWCIYCGLQDVVVPSQVLHPSWQQDTKTVLEISAGATGISLRLPAK